MGVDDSGELNGPATTAKMIFAETPGILTLTSLRSGSSNEQGDGRATLWLRNGAGWQIDLRLLTEPAGGINIRLLGTASPTTVDECAGLYGGTVCPPLNFLQALSQAYGGCRENGTLAPSPSPDGCSPKQSSGIWSRPAAWRAMTRPARFELATSRSGGERSIH